MPTVPPKKALDPFSSLWDLATCTLDRLRADRSTSHSALASVLGVNRSTVARILSGESKLQMRHARTLDDEWRLNGLLAAHVHHATTQHSASWSNERREIARKASELLVWELAWVPGIFQTEAYARAQFTCAGLADVDGAVRERLEDQKTLNQTKPPAIRCLIDQGVIEQPVGGHATMREQLSLLLDLSERFTIRVVPRSAGAHIGRDGSWWIMTVRGVKVAYTEARGPGRLVKDPTEVASHGVWFDWISDEALSRSESARLIRQTMEGFT